MRKLYHLQLIFMKATELHLLQLPLLFLGVKMKSFLIFFLFVIGLCAKPIVSVSIPPQAYFLKQIAQDTLEINTLIPQGSDPHTFEFKPSTLSSLSKSKLYLTIGLEFEKIWIPKLKAHLPKTLSITQGIHFLPSKYEHHDHDHDHDHEEYDPHIWLSPKLVKILAENIASILIENFPEHQALYKNNLALFLQKLDSLDKQITQTLSPIKNRKFIVYHPSWGYYAKAYNLVQIPVQIEGKEPKAQELKSLIILAQKEAIKIIFAQNGFSKNSAQIIAKACGAEVLITDPLAYEWEKELLSITQDIAKWQK